MAFTDAGTQDIRLYLQTYYTYVALFDTTDTEVYRVKTDASNVTLTQAYDNVAKEIKYEVVVTGADVSLPVTIRTAKFFKVATNGTAMTDADATDVTLNATGDSVTITVTLKVPA